MKINFSIHSRSISFYFLRPLWPCSKCAMSWKGQRPTFAGTRFAAFMRKVIFEKYSKMTILFINSQPEMGFDCNNLLQTWSKNLQSCFGRLLVQGFVIFFLKFPLNNHSCNSKCSGKLNIKSFVNLYPFPLENEIIDYL